MQPFTINSKRRLSFGNQTNSPHSKAYSREGTSLRFGEVPATKKIGYNDGKNINNIGEDPNRVSSYSTHNFNRINETQRNSLDSSASFLSANIDGNSFNLASRRYGLGATRLAKAGSVQATSTPLSDNLASSSLNHSLNYTSYRTNQSLSSNVSVKSKLGESISNLNDRTNSIRMGTSSTFNVSNINRNSVSRSRASTPTVQTIPANLAVDIDNNVTSTTIDNNSYRVDKSSKNHVNGYSSNNTQIRNNSLSATNRANKTLTQKLNDSSKNTVLKPATSQIKSSNQTDSSHSSLDKDVKRDPDISFPTLVEEIMKFFSRDITNLETSSYVNRQMKIRRLGTALEVSAGSPASFITKLTSTFTNSMNSIFPFDMQEVNVYLSDDGGDQMKSRNSNKLGQSLPKAIQAWLRMQDTVYSLSTTHEGKAAIILSCIQEAVHLHPTCYTSQEGKYEDNKQSKKDGQHPLPCMHASPSLALLGVARWLLVGAASNASDIAEHVDSIIPSESDIVNLATHINQTSTHVFKAVNVFENLTTSSTTDSVGNKNTIGFSMSTPSGCKAFEMFISCPAQEFRSSLEKNNQERLKRLEEQRISKMLQQHISPARCANLLLPPDYESDLDFASNVEKIGMNDIASSELITDRLIGLGSHLISRDSMMDGLSHSANILGMLGWNEGLSDPLSEKFLGLLPELPLSSGFARALLDKFLIALEDQRVRCTHNQRKSVSILMRRLLAIAEARENCGSLKDLSVLFREALRTAKKALQKSDNSLKSEKKQKKKLERNKKLEQLKLRNQQKRELKRLQEEEKAIERLIREENKRAKIERHRRRQLSRNIEEKNYTDDSRMKDFLKKCGSSWDIDNNHHQYSSSSSSMLDSDSEDCVVEDDISSIESEGQVNDLSDSDSEGTCEDAQLKGLLKGLGGNSADDEDLEELEKDFENFDGLLLDDLKSQRVRVADILDLQLDKALRTLSTDGLHMLSYLMMSFVSFSERLGVEVDKSFKHLDVKIALAFFGLSVLPKNKKELRRKYLELSVKLHPDKNGGTNAAHSDFQLLQQYKKLLDDKIDQAEADAANNIDPDDASANVCSGLSKFNDHLARCSESMQQGFVFDVQKDKGVLDAFVKLAEQSEAPKDVLMMLLLTTRVEEVNSSSIKEDGEIDGEDDEQITAKREKERQEQEAADKARREAEEVRKKADDARREEEARRRANGEENETPTTPPRAKQKPPPVTTREKVVHAIHTALPTCTASVGSLQQKLAERHVEISQCQARRNLDPAGIATATTLTNILSIITHDSPSQKSSVEIRLKRLKFIFGHTFGSREGSMPQQKYLIQVLKVGLLQGLRMSPSEARIWFEDNFTKPILEFVTTGTGDADVLQECTRDVKRMTDALASQLTPLF